MTKFLLISLILHILLTIPLFFSKKAQDKREVTIEVVDTKDVEQDKKGVVKVDEPIKELGDGPDENLAYYWGLGINTLDSYMGKYYVHTITWIGKGYAAEASGLKVGDIIYLINGQEISANNSIRGEGPKKLRLTILRNSDIMVIHTERVKVYY